MNLKELFTKHKEKIAYLFFGVCTTVVNIVAFWIAGELCGLGTTTSNVIAWILSVAFAYVTNRLWVFESSAVTAQEVQKVIVSFFTCRGGTLIVDIVIMYIFVDLLHFPKMVIKVLSNVVVIIANYVLSKVVIFKTKES